MDGIRFDHNCAPPTILWFRCFYGRRCPSTEPSESHLEIVGDLKKRCRNNSTEGTLTPLPSFSVFHLFFNHRTLIKAEKPVLLQCYWLKLRTSSNFTGFSTNELFPFSILSRIPHSLSWFVHLLLINWKSLYMRTSWFCPSYLWQSISHFAISFCCGELVIP